MREDLKIELKRLANDTFPAAARSGNHPVRFNHCFLRIVYDNLFGQRWQNVLVAKRPAIHQLSEEQLRRAIDLGREIIADPNRCAELNDLSLRWRGKR